MSVNKEKRRVSGKVRLFNGKTGEVGEAVEDLLGDFDGAVAKATKVATAPKGEGIDGDEGIEGTGGSIRSKR